MNTRRGFLKGMAGILAVGIAPSIITTPGLLMPVRQIVVPPYGNLYQWLDAEHRRIAESMVLDLERIITHGDVMTATEVLARREESFLLFGERWRRLYG